MRKRLDDYRDIVGDEILFGIFKKALKLNGKRIVHINSTAMGGGVAEILRSLIPLMNDIGMDAGWRVIHGTQDFYNITKKFHNALQGEKINLTKLKKQIYESTNEDFSFFTHLNHDFVIIHDPQPLPLIRYRSKQQPWVWRCHVDLSEPNPDLWHFLKLFLMRYDMMIISNDKYKKADIPIEQKIVFPSIDPLTVKNMDIDAATTAKVLKKFGVPTDKPLITQISRFDKWKDPDGVIEIFKRVRSARDCRLVLCGGAASDDPEGIIIYEKTVKKGEELIKRGEIIMITAVSDVLVNVLQRESSVIIQNSKREGFGLTIAESLWKETPVVATAVGGIPLQVIDGKNGYLVATGDYDTAAERIMKILDDGELRKELGKNGKEHIRKHFLITRLLSDYLDLLNELR